MRPFLHAVGRLVLLSVLCAGPAAQAAETDPAQRLERALAALDSVRADFTQDQVGADGATTDHATGTLYLQKPGRFRWDYATPKQLIVCDGERLWLYDADLQQATVRKVRDSLSQTPAMLLSGQARVRDGFTIRDGGSGQGLSWLVLVPKALDTDFREIRLGFAGAVLKRLEFTDKLNQRTLIELKRLQRNARMDAALFTFTPPAGVDVIGAGH